FDPSMMDNALGEYGKDNSTTHEKDDIDIITYAMADIAKIRDLSNIEPLPTPDDPTPDDPTPDNPVVDGEYNVYYEGSVKTHTYIWDDGNNNFQYAGAWPGKPLTEVNINGRNLKMFSFTPDTKPVNLMIIFNNGSDNSKTPDLKYVNNGIYNDNGFTGETLILNTEVDVIETDNWEPVKYFDFTGTPLPSAPEHGMYIRVQGKKVEKLAR
ncbi:MAG: starch-binding protein, partial [Muribaculaceae bacterium]|nr:starch-binding protein [Muribaculaceae bacterium]